MEVGDYYFAELMIDETLEVSIDLEALAAKEEDSFEAEEVSFAGNSGSMTAYLNKFVECRRNHPGYPAGRLVTILMDREMPPAQKVDSLRLINEQIAVVEANFRRDFPSSYDWTLENERLSNFYGNLCVVHWGKEMAGDLLAEIQRHQPSGSRRKLLIV